MSIALAPTLGVFYQGFSANGVVLSGGLIYTYIAGGTTPQATYTTSTGNVANANPIVLDTAGKVPDEVWLTQGVSYRFDFKDSAGNLIKTYDNIQAPLSYSQLFTTGTLTLLGSEQIPGQLFMSTVASDYNTAFADSASIIAAGNSASTPNGNNTLARFSTDTTGVTLRFVKGRGTAAAATIVASGDSLGAIVWSGAVSASATDNFAQIRAEVDGTPGASADAPGRIVFLTTPDGSGTSAEAMRIASTKAVTFQSSALSVSPTAGIGYGTGAGGAVAQATDKSTTVTSNTVTTLITLSSANLAAATIVSFAFANSAMVSTDHPIATHVSAGTLGAYNATVAPGSGTSTVYVRNNTAGGLAEAIVLRVTIIKAVSA